MFIKDIWLWFSFISRLFYSVLIKYSEHWSRILLFSGTVCVRVVLVLDCHITCIIKRPKVFGGGYNELKFVDRYGPVYNFYFFQCLLILIRYTFQENCPIYLSSQICWLQLFKVFFSYSFHVYRICGEALFKIPDIDDFYSFSFIFFFSSIQLKALSVLLSFTKFQFLALLFFFSSISLIFGLYYFLPLTYFGFPF